MSLRRLPAMLGALALMLATGTTVRAADYLERINTPFPIPERYKLVNDYADILRVARRTAITTKLQALERHNGTQIVFLSVPNVGDRGARAYGQEVFAKWDIGNNGQGNGVLFFVCDEDWYIFTGPGIAGAIPDVTVARIFREIINPARERDEPTEAAEAAIDALIKAAQGEITEPTAYDYLVSYVPVTPEQIAAWALVAVGAAYAGGLWWQRRRKRGTNAQ